MSGPRGNGQNGGHYYSNITQPVEISLSFIVDNTNGAGVRSVKSNGYVKNVFMHTVTTPASGSPNPAAGDLMIQLNNNYNVYLGKSLGFISPVTGAALTSVVASTVYVINALGNTTTANWQAIGLPAGLTPAVGQSFIATASTAITGTGSVKAVGSSGVASAEVVGNPSLSSSNSSVAVNGGAYVLMQFLDYAGSLAAPANETVVNLSLKFDASSVTIDGL